MARDEPRDQRQCLLGVLILDSADLSIPKGRGPARAVLRRQFASTFAGNTCVVHPRLHCALGGHNCFRGSARYRVCSTVRMCGLFRPQVSLCHEPRRPVLLFLFKMAWRSSFCTSPDALFHGLTPLHQASALHPGGPSVSAQKSPAGPLYHGGETLRKIQLHYAFGGLGRRNHRYLIASFAASSILHRKVPRPLSGKNACCPCPARPRFALSGRQEARFSAI